mgnify:CR=1 FL=1
MQLYLNKNLLDLISYNSIAMKILIELPSWIGDSVMATPAIENIIKHFSKCEITLIGAPSALEIFSFHPKILRLIPLNKNYFQLYFLTKSLGDFDLFFSFRGSIRSKILKFFIKSKSKSKSKSKFQYYKNNYKSRHQVEKYNDFISDALNQNFLPGPLVVHNKKFNSNNKKKLLGINPGASYGSAKRWYPEEFAKTAIKFSSTYDILIFGSIKEIEIANDIEKILTSMGVKNFKNLTGITSISELVNHISSLDIFITGDSGPMHIAGSFNVPTVAIFGPTNINETNQWMNKKCINIKKDLNCQPCMKRTCPLRHHNCMKQIKAEDVFNAVQLLDF